jgi:hypothetical protein
VHNFQNYEESNISGVASQRVTFQALNIYLILPWKKGTVSGLPCALFSKLKETHNFPAIVVQE